MAQQLGIAERREGIIHLDVRKLFEASLGGILEATILVQRADSTTMPIRTECQRILGCQQQFSGVGVNRRHRALAKDAHILGVEPQIII